jgi:flagellin-like protein
MKRLFKCRKALSPVVAAIILIAVTVAVSIAVAAWMGALTFSFMGSSSINISNVTFGGASGATTNNTIVLSVKNTGTKSVTVSLVKVNNILRPHWNATLSPCTLSPSATAQITVYTDGSATNKIGWVSGSPYDIYLYDSTGTGLGSTTQTPT